MQNICFEYSKIQQATRINSNLTHYLNILIEMGLFLRKRNFSHNGSKNVTYYIADRFSDFWFLFFYTRERELTLLPVDNFIQTFVYPKIDEFLSIPFEGFSHEIMTYLSLHGYFDEPIITISSYAGYLQDSRTKQKKDFEIDIIGESVNKKILIIGECKWTNSIDDWDIKAFLENKSYFSLKFQSFLDDFEAIKLIFFSKSKIKNSLKKKYSNIDFIDIEKMEFVLNSL